MQLEIVAVSRTIDGEADCSEVENLLSIALDRGLRVREFRVADLKTRWTEPLSEGWVRSACSPMIVFNEAKRLIGSGAVDLVLLSGVDPLRSGYTKDERSAFFQLYGAGRNPLTEYTKLVPGFLEKIGLSRAEFLEIRGYLFDNYLRTWRRCHPNGQEPESRWYEDETEFFRGVDCANPYLDFSGSLVFASSAIASGLVEDNGRVTVLGCGFKQVGQDGPEFAETFLNYDHLREAFDEARQETRVDFLREFTDGRALLEVYTCYPIVPIAFLLRTGLVESPSPGAFRRFLEKKEITITGGLNLARAPANNTTLNNLISMTLRLRVSAAATIGGVHGNGSLGYQQGFMILGRGDSR